MANFINECSFNKKKDHRDSCQSKEKKIEDEQKEEMRIVMNTRGLYM